MSPLSGTQFGDLPFCALQCVSKLSAEATCATGNVTCLCADSTFIPKTTGCAMLNCGVKDVLTLINSTMSACHVPQASQARISPILAGTLGMVALIMVSVRVMQRTMLRQLFGWDDGLIVVAMLCAALLNCLMFPMQKFGLGTNIWTIPFDNITKQLQLLYVAEIFYMAAEALTQLSFLAFYLRIFPAENFRRIVYGLMSLSTCFGISNISVMIFQCTPVSFFWTGWTGESEGSCIAINSFSWYKAAMQIAMDLLILGLPIWPLMRTYLNNKKKAQVLLMFSTGFLITVVSCLRLQSLVQFAESSNPTCEQSSEIIARPRSLGHLANEQQLEDDDTPAVYWSVVECDIAIICACMPCLPSLLRQLFPSVFGEPSTEYGNINGPEKNKSGSIRLDRITKSIQVEVSNSEISLLNRTPGAAHTA